MEFLFSLCCWCWGLAGMYSMALGSAVDLAGLGKAMDGGGASRSVVILGSESLLLLLVGKREGFPAAASERGL